MMKEILLLKTPRTRWYLITLRRFGKFTSFIPCPKNDGDVDTFLSFSMDWFIILVIIKSSKKFLIPFHILPSNLKYTMLLPHHSRVLYLSTSFWGTPKLHAKWSSSASVNHFT
mmetsp:Transcript_31944/g.65612  ORF Transcript_31944/g.65612 Transcript_31944/m.65612 type:complete len:113 (+) Transcript_31944:340-678(+)